MTYIASVIIPVYNAEKMLRRCVESLVLGNERNIEIILCDDCSTDESWKLCEELTEKYLNVKSLQNSKNSGVSYTRNHALSVATGEFVLFVDSDDWVSSKYAHKLIELANKYPFSLPICGQHYIDKVNGFRRTYTWENQMGTVSKLDQTHLFELVDQFLLQQLWNKIFRRDVIEKHRIRFDETQSMGEDFQFVLDYMEAAQIKNCVVLNEPLYYYIRWNNNSLMSAFGLAQRSQEYKRAEQLYRISGLKWTTKRDELIEKSRKNYVYHIVRNPKLTKAQKLEVIEQILRDGGSRKHYTHQRCMYIKEQLSTMILKIKQLPARVKGRVLRKKVENIVFNIRKKIQTGEFTLISQNCIGGVLYHDLKMQFLSPMINTFIKEPDFVRLALNLRYYISQPIIMRWEEEYPVGTLDDIEIHFMHYETCEEAKEAWERRVKRINWDKIIVLSTDRDGFDDALYEQWKEIPYPKILFTVHPEYTADAVYFPEYIKDGQIGDLISDRSFYRDNSVITTINQLKE